MTSSRIDVRVQTKARIAGVSLAPDGTLTVSVNEAPVDGKANEAVVSLLAKALGLPKRDVIIVFGQRGRRKVVELPMEREEVRKRLSQP